MNPNMQFERDLERWLQAEAPASAPAGLHAAVIDRARTRRQRPGWAVSPLGRWLSRNRGLTLFAVGALLLVGGTLAAGSGLVRLPSVVPPEPAPTLPAAVIATSSPAVDSASPTPMPTPAPTDAGRPAQPGQFADVCDFGLATPSVGWVSTATALYRTENLGRTWSAVTPPGWHAASTWPTAPASGSGRITSLFLDADTAYTYLPGAPGTAAVTHDGGTSWAEQTLAGTTASQSSVFWFQAPSSGSLIFWATNKGDPSRVFATSDGGATWSSPRPGPAWSDLNNTNTSTMLGWCGHNAAQSVLVRTVTPPGDTSVANGLQVSHDAGATWIKRTLPVGPQAPASRPTALVDRSVITAWEDPGGRIVMALSVMFNGQSLDQIYTSSDDGRSWEYLQTQVPLHIGQNSQFLSATEWILVAPDASTFMSTTDGGATWRTVTGAAPFGIASASFGSPDVGWAIPDCQGMHLPYSSFCDPTDVKGLKKVLLQTTDGGATWNAVGQ
jgi:photosystem II stability/assembly factor-like uncharacterized protein